MIESESHSFTNRLVHEKSPYLLQHAHNPVDWYSWGEEAFETAAKEDKPIFLSIGYATCHWCHVMERESFENEEIAKLMNEAFVCIKVDREERPDIDNIYMTVAQMMTGQGGWPLTIVMTPEKEPFHAATYIPPDQRFGRIGMKQLVPRIEHAWKHQRAKVLESSGQIAEILVQQHSEQGEGELDRELLNAGYEDLISLYDEEKGGFGTQPKFPTPHRLLFLLRHGKPEGIQAVEHTLLEMRKGGIFDHIGFGFHRYSTDRDWLLPHFEKMLYDQALLVMAYVEAHELTGNPLYRQVAEEVLEYVLRDMTVPGLLEAGDTEGPGLLEAGDTEGPGLLEAGDTEGQGLLEAGDTEGQGLLEADGTGDGDDLLEAGGPEGGGFYSAEDADSEGEEGLFYIWSADELRLILGEEYDFAAKIWNVSDSGNFRDESTGLVNGKNIPYYAAFPSNGSSERISTIREQLFDVREKRIHPLKDTKVLADWNGLMISAFARAGRVFEEKKYVEAAVRANDFIESEMTQGNGELWHRWRDGHTAVTGQLEDYAFMIQGLLELYDSTFDLRYIRKALEYNQILTDSFSDEAGGGYFMTADDAEELLVRPKEFYDGAIPSGNSVHFLNLLRLARLTGNAELEEKAAEVGNAFSGKIERSPSNFAMALMGLQFAEGETVEVVVVGERGHAETRDMLDYVSKVYRPGKVVLFKDSNNAAEVHRIAPFTKEQVMVDGKTTVYICRNFSCDQPVTSLDELKRRFR